MGAPPFRDVVQDPVVTQRNGRYVIPIRAEARGQVPAIVHDQSASGATLFVEPLAVVDMANRWRTLILDEEREVERILRSLSQEVGSADALSSSVVGLAQLDLARAASALAEQQRATAPELVAVPRPAEQPVLRLNNARHPLLTGRVVPISLELGGDFDVLLVTGPNTGGKTVALQDRRLTVADGSGRPVRARRRGIADRRVRTCAGGHRRRTEPAAESVDVFESHFAHRADAARRR